MTFAVGPKANGTLPLVETPDPFGPLNRDQSSPDAGRWHRPAAADRSRDCDRRRLPTDDCRLSTVDCRLTTSVFPPWRRRSLGSLALDELRHLLQPLRTA